MRLRSIIVAGLMLAPVTAFAQEATPAAPSVSTAPVAAAPAADGHRTLAIAAGVVVGVIVVEFLSGGTMTPVLVAGGQGAMAMEPAVAAGAVGAAPMSAGWSVAEVVKIVAGGWVGGAVGDWLYSSR